MSFFNKAGKMAIGSRLRLLTDKVTEDAALLYQLYGVDLQPKWWPVFHALSKTDMPITAIATEIGHSHPSVSKIVAEMLRNGIVTEKKDKSDGRRNRIALSKKGRAMLEKLQYQYTDVNKTIEDMIGGSRNDLWKAIEEWEFMLGEKSLFRRVQEQKKWRESQAVSIIDYQPEYRQAFKALNEEWISTYFKMEDADYKALDHPREYILDKGGAILVALFDGEVAGVCALIRMQDPDYDFELAKMAVSPKFQGKNIGWLLGQAAIAKAKSLGAAAIYLESNTMLQPAIKLYLKLGFQRVFGRPTPYERANIQMELKVN